MVWQGVIGKDFTYSADKHKGSNTKFVEDQPQYAFFSSTHIQRAAQIHGNLKHRTVIAPWGAAVISEDFFPE